MENQTLTILEQAKAVFADVQERFERIRQREAHIEKIKEKRLTAQDRDNIAAARKAISKEMEAIKKSLESLGGTD